MMKSTTILATGALGLGVSTAAYAQPEYYGGVFLDFSNLENLFSDASTTDRTTDVNHRQLGLLFGARWPVGGWYIGGEIDRSFDISGSELNSPYSTLQSACSANADSVCNIEDVTRLKLLVGRNVGDYFLFGTAGPNWTTAEIDPLNGAPVTEVTEQGHTISLGLERSFDANGSGSLPLTLRLEILRDYVDFRGVDDPANYNNQLTNTTIRAGAIFKF